MDIQKKPNRDADLLEKTDSPEINAYMAWQHIVCGRKKQDILIFQLTIQRIRNPANTTNEGEKIIGYYSCPGHQSSHKNKYQLDFAMVKG
jgi:hypothetical protein